MYFIKAQEAKTERWRYFVTFIPVLFAYLVIGSIPLYVYIWLSQRRGTVLDLQRFSHTSDPSAIGLSQNAGLLILIFPSVLAFFVLLISIIKIHGTSIGRIASASGRIRWKRFFGAALLWWGFLIISELIFAFLDPANYTFQFNLKLFIPLLIFSLFLLPFQTWFEELVFRSYLMQGIGILTGYRFPALIVTSLIFGMLHIMNPEVGEFGYMATLPYYVGFGLFAGLLVIFDDGIEMACGIHAINNIHSAVLVTYNHSALKTPAVWSINRIDPWLSNIAFVVAAVLFFLIMARIYKWGDWNKLFRRIPALSELKNSQAS